MENGLVIRSLTIFVNVMVWMASGYCFFSTSSHLDKGLHFGSKKTEFLDKSSKTIDIFPNQSEALFGQYLIWLNDGS